MRSLLRAGAEACAPVTDGAAGRAAPLLHLDQPEGQGTLVASGWRARAAARPVSGGHGQASLRKHAF